MPFRRAVLAILPLALAGCISVTENRLADGSLSVEIADSGWYILDSVPIATGNPDGWWPHWFTDDDDPRMTGLVLDRILAREKAKTVGPIVTRETGESILLLLNLVTYRTSAVIPPQETAR